MSKLFMNQPVFSIAYFKYLFPKSVFSQLGCPIDHAVSLWEGKCVCLV